MEVERRTLRVGAAVIICAIVLRLISGGAVETVISALTSPQAASVLLFLETGRIVRPAEPQPPTQPTTEPAQTETVSPETVPPETIPTQPQLQEEQAVAVFNSGDAALVEVNSVCGYEADVEGYLQQTLSWDLTQQQPTVLILHTHGTESYEKTEKYEESSAYRTKDTGYNVVSIGDRLVQVLEAGGIKAVHDRTLHDSPSYSDSYNNARESIRQYLEKYPSIRLVLDIHRDAVEDSQGEQMKFTAQAQGKTAASLMMVVGTDASGLTHPHWPENMSLAVKLHAQLEKNTPGICRPISFRSQRFNQDLCPGGLIVEVGAAGNTRQEALVAVELLGQAIIDIAAGANPDKK